MHHLLLLIVLVAGLVLFFVLPWPLNLILYAPILVAGLVAYGKALRAQRLPQQTGERAMVGRPARVVTQAEGSLEVMVEGEIWRAVCPEPVRVGQEVVVERVDGLTLHVAPDRRTPDESRPQR